MSFHILGLWRKKNETKIPTQIFGILHSVAEGKQTYYFFRPKLDTVWNQRPHAETWNYKIRSSAILQEYPKWIPRPIPYISPLLATLFLSWVITLKMFSIFSSLHCMHECAMHAWCRNKSIKLMKLRYWSQNSNQIMTWIKLLFLLLISCESKSCIITTVIFKAQSLVMLAIFFFYSS